MNKNNSNNVRLMFDNFYIFTDTCFHHEGDFQYLLELIKLSVKGNSNGVKFQILLDLDEYYTSDAKKIPSSYVFTKEQWQEAINLAFELGLNVIIMPLCNKALNFTKENLEKISAIEIHSVNLNDYFLLKEISKMDIPVILSVGGRTLEEIYFALEEISSLDREIYIMFGFQSFPTDYFELNLNKLKELEDTFRLKIGYADHTSFQDDYGKTVVDIAFVKGAKLFEFHLTKNKGEMRVDYEAAYNFEDLLDIRNRLNKISRILGKTKSLSDLNESEKKYRGREKQLVAKISIQKNEIISFKHLTYKISKEQSDFKQSEIINLIGKKALNQIEKDMPIKYDDIQK